MLYIRNTSVQRRCWEGNIWSGPCGGDVTENGCGNTFPKKKNNMLSIPVHLFSGRDKQWRKVQMWFFRPANYLCFLIKVRRTLPTLRKNVVFYLKIYWRSNCYGFQDWLSYWGWPPRSDIKAERGPPNVPCFSQSVLQTLKPRGTVFPH